VIPRFTGNQLYARRLAEIQWWLANVGLLLMVTGFALAPHGVRLASAVLGLGGTLEAIGAYCFAYNLWRTMDAAPKKATAIHRAAA
jgi:cbb3-type cytochrome oxidase subunit 1